MSSTETAPMFSLEKIRLLNSKDRSLQGLGAGITRGNDLVVIALLVFFDCPVVIRMSELLSPSQAGRLINRGGHAIIGWIRKHGLPAIKLPSGQYLIEKDKFMVWLEGKGVTLPLNSDR